MTSVTLTFIIVFIIGVDLIYKHVVTMATTKQIYIYMYIRLLYKTINVNNHCNVNNHNVITVNPKL